MSLILVNALQQPCCRCREHVMEGEVRARGGEPDGQAPRAIPEYLQRNYWWAYLHPRVVRLFERQWLVNVILCGNFAQLRDAVLEEFGRTISGPTLQVACVYGDFSPRLAERVAPGSGLDVVDVLPIQHKRWPAPTFRGSAAWA
jgi:hypothetical protein